jgi:hypothetical protein
MVGNFEQGSQESQDFFNGTHVTSSLANFPFVFTSVVCTLGGPGIGNLGVISKRLEVRSEASYQVVIEALLESRNLLRTILVLELVLLEAIQHQRHLLDTANICNTVKQFLT